jgi:hypothetical protein
MQLEMRREDSKTFKPTNERTGLTWQRKAVSKRRRPRKRRSSAARFSLRTRFAAPREIASFVVFVGGSGGSYAVGQNFMVDGGYR